MDKVTPIWRLFNPQNWTNLNPSAAHYGQ